MDELDHGGEQEPRLGARGGPAVATLVPCGGAGEEDERRAHPLAPRADEVPGHLAHERDIRVEPVPDQRVHALEVLGDGRQHGQ